MVKAGGTVMRRTFFALALLVCFPVMADEQIQALALFPGKAVLSIDGQHYTLAIGESTPEGIRLLAADSNRALLEAGGKRRMLTLGTQISSHYPAAQMKVVNIYPDSGGMYRVDGAINGQAINFLVDTGASAISMSSEQAKRLGIDYRQNGTVGMAETASARVMVHLVKLDEVKVGTLRVYNVDAMVLDGAQPRQVLLGQSFLNQLHMKRDGTLLRLEQSH